MTGMGVLGVEVIVVGSQDKGLVIFITFPMACTHGGHDKIR